MTVWEEVVWRQNQRMQQKGKIQEEKALLERTGRQHEAARKYLLAVKWLF